MVDVSVINSYSSKWVLEGQFDTAEDIATEWMVEVSDVYDALDDLTLINNRYIIHQDELGEKIQAISAIIEEGLLDVLGDSLDKEDDRLITYQVELKQEVEKSRQYKHDYETISRKYMTVEHEKDLLLKQNKDLDEQLQVSRSNHQSALKQIDESNQLASRYQQEALYTQELLAQVESILTGVETSTQTPHPPESDIVESEIQENLEEELELEYEQELALDANQATSPEQRQSKGKNKKGGQAPSQSVKKVSKARVKWEQVLTNPSFPLITELKQKKFWHVSELASKLSKPPRSIVTESDLDFIVHNVFKGLGYKKEMPNPKLLNAEEATWIILASYYNSDTTLVGLERLAKSVEVLYDDWNTNHAVIKKTLKQG